MMDELSKENMIELQKQLKAPCPPGGNFDKLCSIVMSAASMVIGEVLAKKK